MEPNYVGPNKRMDAMAVAWLFAQDCVFFNPGEITWDGTHHGIAGAQINAEKVNDIPTFMENAGMYYQGIGDLLMTLEQDEELIVPRAEIHPGLHDAIREGDLTGITLFNLQACARAFQFLSDENEGVKRSMLQMAGLGDLADNPNAMACTYAITVDQRLTRGIPGFYRLIRRMFEDMRAYNEIDLPYILLFAAARNVDADQCLEYFDDSVEGAVSESFHVETNMEEWKAAHGIDDDDNANEGAGEEEGDERSAIIGMLRLLVLAADLSGGYQFPQDILDELERAENGDETVDVEDLARRMNELSPDQTEMDPLAWTYDQGRRAEGPAFSVAIPDGYDIHKDVESGIGNNRPFVAVVEGTDEQAIGGSDQIVYVDHGLLGILSDEESMSMLREWGTVDLLVHLQRAAVVESYDMGVRVLEERLVPCVNGKCLVSLRKNFSACEFYIMPMMFNSSAWLKVGLTQCPAEEAGKYMDAICELAKTVELVEPPVSNLVAKANGYKAALAPACEIIETFEGLCNPMLTSRKQDIESAHELFLKENPMHTTEGEVFSQARALTRWGDENIDVLELLVDIYEAQQKAGMPYEDQVTLYDYLSTDFCTLYKMNLGSEGEPWDVKAKSAGVLRLPEGFEELRKRWEVMKPSKSSAGKTGEKASVANVTGNAPSQEPKREKKKMESPRACGESVAINSEDQVDDEGQSAKTSEEGSEPKDNERALNAAEDARKAEEKALEKINEAARKAEEEARKERESRKAYDKFIELDTEIAALRRNLDDAEREGKTPSELAAEKISSEIRSMRSEHEKLGLFARSKKKELAAEIEKREQELKQIQARIPNEREEAKKERLRKARLLKADIRKLEAEIKPYEKSVLSLVTDAFKHKGIGDIVQFGSFPQDSADALPSPIEWQIVEREGNSILLLCTHVLFGMEMNYTEGKSASYVGSDLDKHLSGAFKNRAFNELEQRMISDGPRIMDTHELRKYIKSKYGLACKATEYALANGAEAIASRAAFYWVATLEKKGFYYYVNTQGTLLGGGGTTYSGGMNIGNNGLEEIDKCGVRPAIRVQLR